MPDYQINLQELLRPSFGDIAPRTYPGVNLPGNQESNISYEGVDTLEVDETNILSAMGTPVVMPVKFKGGTYQARDDQGRVEYRYFYPYELPHASVIEFSWSREVVKTRIAGASDRKRGTVKEMVAEDDWQIRVKGVLCSFPDDKYPDGDLRDLREFRNIPVAVEIEEGKLFEMLGIYNVVCTKLDLSPKRGFVNTQPFVLDLVSDQPEELDIEDSN